MAQVINLTVEAGGKAILRCTSSNQAKELVNEAVESKGPSNTLGLDKGCKWELDGEEIQLSSTRHSLYSDESRVSVDHVYTAGLTKHNLVLKSSITALVLHETSSKL